MQSGRHLHPSIMYVRYRDPFPRPTNASRNGAAVDRRQYLFKKNLSSATLQSQKLGKYMIRENSRNLGHIPVDELFFRGNPVGPTDYNAFSRANTASHAKRRKTEIRTGRKRRYPRQRVPDT
ncbi:PREDICTED: uncharacterized protein LOC108768842 [Trachymyrmex cornetzi]|uniref:uncharacterized protein LOC108768842 n=1 Tax=Trachymyrmex cornetzi TaxID=471704 RepID=UPI00084EFE1F|nr:PREDICTED: uncharacterized protein LOC108768842 [Trachymyrmex cornetzi]